MIKKILGIVVLLGLIGAAVGYYYYSKPTESLKDAPAVLCVSADSLFSQYEMDEVGANAKFLDKVIEVDGKVQSVNTDTSGLSLTLQTGSGMFGVICKLEDKSTPETIAPEEAKLNRSVPIPKPISKTVLPLKSSKPIAFFIQGAYS